MSSHLKNLFIPPLVAALLYGFVALLLWHMPASGDAADYLRDARLLLETGATDLPVYYYPPGTSYWLLWLAKVTGSLTAARLLSGLICVLATVWLSQALTERLLPESRAKALAGFLAACFVPLILLSGQPYPQVLSLICLGTTALCWLKALGVGGKRGQGRHSHTPILFLLAGITLGCGALTRPASLSVGLAMAITGLDAFFRKARDNRREKNRLLAGAGICLVAAGLTVAPTVIHNYRGGGGLTLSINNERNFWLGNNPYTPLYKTTHLAQRPLDELDRKTRDYLESHYIREEIHTPMERVKRSRELRTKRLHSAWQHIVDRPGLFLLRTFNRARAFWGFDYLGSRQIQEWRRWRLVQAAPIYLLEAGSYGAVMALALIGFGTGSRGQGAGGGVPKTQRPKGLKTQRNTTNHEPRTKNQESARTNGQLAACNSQDFSALRAPSGCALLLFILSYQLPYCLAFSAGTYHFPVMVLVFPLAAGGLVKLREKGVMPALRNWRVQLALAIFSLIQIEYAYFALKHA